MTNQNIYDKIDKLNDTLGIDHFDENFLFLDPAENNNDAKGDEDLERAIIECSLSDQLTDLRKSKDPQYESLSKGVTAILGFEL